MTLAIKDGSGASQNLSSYVDGSSEHNPRHSIITAEGAGATIGTTADAAVITNTTGTLSSKLRGIVALLAAGIGITSVPADPFGANADAAVEGDNSASVQGHLRGLAKTAGSQADAAVNTNTTGSINGHIRGIIAIILDVLGISTDAAATMGSTGSLSAKIRQISADLGASSDAGVVAGNTGTLSAKLRQLSAVSGDSTDSAVTTNTTGTYSSKLRGIVALLAAAIDITNSFMRSQIVPFTSGGLLNYHVVAAATTNAANIKASAGQVYGWNIYNNAAYAVYVKFHNTSGTPTAGTGVVHTIGIPAGGGNNEIGDIGMAFSTGIGITIVKDITDAGNTAVALSDCVVDVKYK